jgi:hypothetical protein
MIAVLSSGYGALSLAYCKDCCENNLEPYGIMVSYIACGGKFPEEINPTYVNDVRRILKALEISEEKFTKDCNSFWDNYGETE